MSVQFTDNSDKVMNALNEAIKNGLSNAVSILTSSVKSKASDKSRSSWQSSISDDGMSATISNDNVEAIHEEFGKGEYSVAPDLRENKGEEVQHPTRPLQRSIAEKRGVIEKAFADELKNL